MGWEAGEMAQGFRSLSVLQRSQAQLPTPVLETSYPCAISFQDLTPSSDFFSHLPVYGAHANTQDRTHGHKIKENMKNMMCQLVLCQLDTS